jgi:hypothetical protein
MNTYPKSLFLRVTGISSFIVISLMLLGGVAQFLNSSRGVSVSGQDTLANFLLYTPLCYALWITIITWPLFSGKQKIETYRKIERFHAIALIVSIVLLFVLYLTVVFMLSSTMKYESYFFKVFVMVLTLLFAVIPVHLYFVYVYLKENSIISK